MPGWRRDRWRSAPVPAGAAAARLPFAVGSSFVMFQGNCPPNPTWGHHGKYAYDFQMPIGTPIHAMRDGTVSNYLHMTQSSVVVMLGAAVAAGDLLGFSGNSGASDRPHLHVEAYASLGNFVKSNTLPITFSNAEGPLAPSGELVQDQAYTAAPVP